MKTHLKHFFPFLHKEFRKLEEKELQSEETFKELFPNEPIELWKLKTIFVYQKDDYVTGDDFKEVITKPKKNAKI